MAASPPTNVETTVMAPDAVLRRAQRGDDAAFAALWREHQNVFLGVAIRVLGNRQDAEDAVQEAAMKAFKKLPKFHRTSNFKTWATKIVFNASIDALRGNEVRQALALRQMENVAFAQHAPDALESVIQMDEINDLWQGIDSLDVDLKMAILFDDFVGLTTREISDSLEAPEYTIRKRVFRSRRILQRRRGRCRSARR